MFNTLASHGLPPPPPAPTKQRPTMICSRCSNPDDLPVATIHGEALCEVCLPQEDIRLPGPPPLPFTRSFKRAATAEHETALRKVRPYVSSVAFRELSAAKQAGVAHILDPICAAAPPGPRPWLFVDVDYCADAALAASAQFAHFACVTLFRTTDEKPARYHYTDNAPDEYRGDRLSIAAVCARQAITLNMAECPRPTMFVVTTDPAFIAHLEGQRYDWQICASIADAIKML